RGMTAAIYPKTDAFDVDYVAHEMGHQFGAHHTFNGGVVGSCTVANYYAASAYEPGSGSTIMSYTGLCGAQNLQRRTDAYFHAISLSEIQTYKTSGTGSTCGTVVTTTNNKPTANADPNSVDGKYIPISTPFELTGAGTDPDGNPVTYVWEQVDLGAQGAPSSASATAPLFRSFLPSTNAKRSFPILYDILDNTSSVGEKLPSVSRDLNFNLTVRDNQTVGGGFGMDLIILHVTNAAGPFAITSHNATSNVEGNITVTWSVAGTTAAPISCANVDIMLSLDGGITFTNLVTATANDGSETITLPNTSTSAARIKIKCSDNVFFDINNADLRITPANSTCGERVTAGSMSTYVGWTEYSSNGQFIVDNTSPYHNATGSAWLGYLNNETARLSQTINIPAGSSFANLEFWYKYDRTDCGGDVFNVKVNGSIVKTYNMCNDEGASDWKRQLIDMSAYIGTSPIIMFEIITNAIYPSDLFIDDVSVYTCSGGEYLILPVEFAKFEAKADRNNAILNWATASEANNAGFEVEMRSEDSGFQKLGFVAGKGNSNELAHYSFNVKDLEPGSYYFRLKQLDLNGNYTYSPIRQVNFKGDNIVHVYPNPVGEIAYFEFTLSNQEKLSLDLLDNVGRVVGQIAADEFASGTYKFAENISHLPNGIYYYRLKTGLGAEIGKFVIAK
ncbi:MAG: T9SS type A sorting domain-containing protein, partial [Saprospiraceae bacterium]|nr:T9SS type A sorting domain-containing protein [Saprospiraceae bacterium]